MHQRNGFAEKEDLRGSVALGEYTTVQKRESRLGGIVRPPHTLQSLEGVLRTRERNRRMRKETGTLSRGLSHSAFSNLQPRGV